MQKCTPAQKDFSLKKLTQLFVVLSVVLLSACGTKVHTSASKAVGYTTQIDTITIIAKDDDKFTESGQSPLWTVSLGTMISNVFATLEVRMPKVFKANGVSIADFQYLSKLKKADPQTRIALPTHALVLRPTSARGTGKTEAGIEFQVWLTDLKTNAQVWKGNISYHQSNFLSSARTMDNNAADEFSKALLIQLKKDKLINQSGNEPVLAKE